MPIIFCLELPITCCRTRKAIVNEHNPMPHKNLRFNFHPFTNECMARNLTPGPHFHPSLNLYKSTYFCFVPNLTTVNIYKFTDFDIFSQDNVLRNQITGFNLCIHAPIFSDFAVRHLMLPC